MAHDFLPPWPLQGSSALTLALLALIAAVCGELATRLRVPRLIGYTAISVVFAAAAAALSRISLAPIEADEFRASIDGSAADADDRILYNTVTGELFYDADGSGEGTATRIAVLSGAPALEAADIVIG